MFTMGNVFTNVVEWRYSLIWQFKESRKNFIIHYFFMFWTKLLFVIASIFMGWYLYNYIRQNKEAFSAKNLDKGFFALGILALFLIAFVAVLVMFVRQH